MLYGNIQADIAITGGVHIAEDVVKSHDGRRPRHPALFGPAAVRHRLSAPLAPPAQSWMDKHEYQSVRQMQGCMCQKNVPNPKALQRANYMHVLSSYTEALK